MGIGDEIMAAGQARTEFVRTGKRVRILDQDGRPRWCDVWDNLPWLATPGEQGDFSSINNYPGLRPYIAYPFNRETGCRYSGWRARDNLGGLIFNQSEMDFAASVRNSLGDFVIVEPTLTERTNPNKQWGRAKWQELTHILKDRGYRVVQVGPTAIEVLDGCQFIETPTFRVGAAVLQQSIGAVLPEGGLHHAAGMLRKRVVVLFGGAVDVNATGYEDHINIVRGEACGNWLPCDHCKEIWGALQPSEVADLFIDSLSRVEK